MKQTIQAWALIGAAALIGACAGAGDGTAVHNAPAGAPPETATPAAPATPAATPETPAATPAPASGSPDTADYGKYYGSCKKDATKHCSDGYCKGAQCDQVMTGAAKSCDAVYSQTKCPAGATAICLLPTDIGGNIINSVNSYYDGENHEPSCKAFGARMLKQ